MWTVPLSMWVITDDLVLQFTGIYDHTSHYTCGIIYLSSALHQAQLIPPTTTGMKKQFVPHTSEQLLIINSQLINFTNYIYIVSCVTSISNPKEGTAKECNTFCCCHTNHCFLPATIVWYPSLTTFHPCQPKILTPQ